MRLLLVIVFALIGCSPEPEREKRIATSSEDRRTTREVSPTDPDPEIVAPPGEPDPEPITIAGSLIDQRGDPIAGRRFVTVGRDRDQRTGRTGPRGEIAVEGVVPPYDLRVEDAEARGPSLFFGLSRPDPVVELREGTTHTAPPQAIRLGVLAPSCGEEPCVVDVVTASPSGEGSASVLAEPRAGEAYAIVDVDHVWRTTRPRDGERLSVHVLVHDAAKKRFAYARRDAIEPGAAADIGVVRAAVVAANAEVRMGALTEGFGSDVSWTSSLALDVGGATFALESAHAPSLTTSAPLIEGASWRFAVSAAKLGNIRSAWSGSRDAHEPAAPLALPSALPTIAVADGRLRWSPDGTKALAIIDVVDVARATYRYRIVTSLTDFPLAKLENLGLRGMERGTHELVITVTPEASLDEAVDPDPSVRTRHRDPGRAGQALHARVPFDVTP